jgi:MFS family permease
MRPAWCAGSAAAYSSLLNTSRYQLPVIKGAEVRTQRPATFTIVLDTTIVNVALPSIGQGVKASPAALEWIVSGYALSFGLALVPAGRLGDRFGSKPIFVTGLTLFTLASVGCGVSGSAA